jgi:hypothetical protein
MALSASVQREFVGEQDEISVLLADSDIYYAGGILVETTGKGSFVTSAAVAQPIFGILTGKYSDGDSVDAKTIGASNTIKAIVKRGKVWLPHTSAAQTDVGALFVPDSDNSMTDVPATATSRFYAYVALDYDSDKGLLFDLRNPVIADNET